MTEIFEVRSEKPTHKTSGISKTAFRQGMLTETERIRLNKAMRCITNNISMDWLEFDLEQDAEAIGKPGLTYFDLLAESFASYNDAIDLDVNNAQFINGIRLQETIGLLDEVGRADEILLGLPL